MLGNRCFALSTNTADRKSSQEQCGRKTEFMANVQKYAIDYHIAQTTILQMALYVRSGKIVPCDGKKECASEVVELWPSVGVRYPKLYGQYQFQGT